MLRQSLITATTIGCVIALASTVLAQTNNFGTRSNFGSGSSGGLTRNTSGTFGGQGNRTQGFSQTGQLTNDNMVDRQAGAFTAAASQNAADFRSMSGTGGLGGTGLGGLGTGLGGFGSSFGGLGGGYSPYGLGGGLGRGGNQQFQQLGQNQTGNTTGNIRTTLRVAFTVPESTSYSGGAISADVTQRLSDIPQLRLRTPVEVEVAGRTAILRGAVASEHDRDLAERLLLLEPGISRVQNELTVASGAATGGTNSTEELTPPLTSP